MYKRIKKWFKDAFSGGNNPATFTWKQEIDIIVRDKNGNIKAERHIKE